MRSRHAILLMLPLFAWSQSSKSIDMRDVVENNQDTFHLIFSARGGFPGHAFVTLAGEDYTRKMSHSQTFGLYPDKKSAKLLFGKVPGNISDEYKSGKQGLFTPTWNLRVQVSSIQFKDSKKILEKWQSNTQYQLLEQDCVTFMSEVAKYIGLNLPQRLSMVTPRIGIGKPVTFVEELISINDGKQHAQNSNVTQKGPSSNTCSDVSDDSNGLSADDAALILDGLTGWDRYNALFAIKNKIRENISARELNKIVGDEAGSSPSRIISLAADRLAENTKADGVVILIQGLEGYDRYNAVYSINPYIADGLSAVEVDNIAGKEAKTRGKIVTLIGKHIK